MNSSSIQFLNDSHFSVDSSGTLHASISGFSLILFYSTQCPHCKEMMEAVKQMPKLINGCSFGVINLDQNKGVIQKCAKSQLQLKYVPFLVFFASGLPYMVYSGPTDTNEIKRFIVQVSEAYVKEFQTKTQPTERPGQNGREMSERGMVSGNKNQTGMPSSQPQKGSAKPMDLACKLDDMACLEHSVKKYSGCYISMLDAYVNKIGNK